MEVYAGHCQDRGYTIVTVRLECESDRRRAGPGEGHRGNGGEAEACRAVELLDVVAGKAEGHEDAEVQREVEASVSIGRRTVGGRPMGDVDLLPNHWGGLTLDGELEVAARALVDAEGDNTISAWVNVVKRVG